MNDQEILKQKIKNLNPPPVIVIIKNDSLFAQNFINDIKNMFFSFILSDLNYKKIDYTDYKMSNIILELNTMPFLSSHKFVELINPNKIDENDLKIINKYFENPHKYSILFVVFDYLDKRTKLYNFFSKLEFFYDFNSDNNKEAINHIFKLSKELKIDIDEELANFLFSYYEKDLFVIKSFLEKLSLTKDKLCINMGNINSFLISNDKIDPFVLVKNIAQGNLSESLLGLELLRLAKESPIKFLALLMWQFRVIVQIRELLDNGLSDWDIRKQVNVYNERYEWMSKIALKKTLDFHISRMTRLLAIDEMLKSSSIKDPFIWIEKIIYQSCFGLN